MLTDILVSLCSKANSGTNIGRRMPNLLGSAKPFAFDDVEITQVPCSDRLFTLSSFSKLEIARRTNKREWKRVYSHKNAKRTPRGRAEMAKGLDSMPAAGVTAGFGVSWRTFRKGKSRCRQGGVEVLVGKSSRLMRCLSMLTVKTFEEIFSLRQRRSTRDAIMARLGHERSSVFVFCANLAVHGLLLWR